MKSHVTKQIYLVAGAMQQSEDTGASPNL